MKPRRLRIFLTVVLALTIFVGVASADTWGPYSVQYGRVNAWHTGYQTSSGRNVEVINTSATYTVGNGTLTVLSKPESIYSKKQGTYAYANVTRGYGRSYAEEYDYLRAHDHKYWSTPGNNAPFNFLEDK